MSQFVQIGQHWINLDQVTGVELINNPEKPGTVWVARVHFSAGASKEFRRPEEIQFLEDFLKSHKAS